MNKSPFTAVLVIVFSVLSGLATQEAKAQLAFGDPSDFSSLVDNGVTTLIRTAAIATNHRPYATATPLKLAPGIDIGLDITWAMLPTDFTTILAALGAGEVTGLPIPKINIRKGLPVGINIGMTGFFFAGLTVGGGDVQWSILKGEGAAPAIAVRGAYNYSDLVFIKSHNFSVDGVISKNLKIFDPYFGMGMQVWSGSLVIPESALATVPVTLTTSATGVAGHLFGGFSLKLLILKLVFEGDYNFNGTTSLGGKVAISF